MERGYDPSRFIFQVKQDLLCFLCHRVLKEPRLCEAEEHCFCLSCITQHLDKEAKTCPECREPLALETLKLSQRFLKKVLSELRIRCDYNDRGCPEQVKLRNLKDHVTDCQYRPTLDAEKYNSKVSEKDQQNFSQMKAEFSSEGAVAQVGCDNRPKKRDELAEKYDDMREEMKRMKDETKGEVTELKRRYDDIYDKVKKMKTNVDQLTPSQDEMKTQIQEMEKKQKQIETNVNKLTPSQAELKIKHLEMARKQDQMEMRQDETKKALDEMKQTQSGINEKVQEMEVHDLETAGKQDRQDHVNKCEYRPVSCENCRREIEPDINRISRRLDEMEESQNLYRQEVNKVNNSYEEIRTLTNEIEQEKKNEVIGKKRKYGKIHETVKKIKIVSFHHRDVDQLTPSQDEMKTQIQEMAKKQKQMETNVNKLTPSQAELNIQHLQMARKQDQMKVRQDETKKALDEVKQTQSGINEKVEEMEVHHLQMARKQDETKKALDEMKQTQSGINEKAEEIERNLHNMGHMLLNRLNREVQGNASVMEEQFNRFIGLLDHKTKERTTNRNGSQAMDPTIQANNQDVIILGGRYTSGVTLDTVEKYNIVEKRSTLLPRLNHPREQSALCVYNNDVLVVGGYGKHALDTNEVLKINQHPLGWKISDGKLPVNLYGHDVIVYQGKLYVIGGYDWDEEQISSAIYEIALTPPYTAKLLTRMPEARGDHRAELVNGKLFILGGTTTGLSEDVLDSVVVYDLIKNEFKPCPSLPQPVNEMSTVTWGDKIIVLGGEDKNGESLSDVFMYDTETGQIEPLPSMIYKRSGSSAVIMNDVIVVFGGRNNEQGYLNSVETFTIGGDGWKELPGMIEKRCWATAVVKPHI